MHDTRSRALIVAPYYLPSTSVGATRATQLAAHLPEKWHAHIITFTPSSSDAPPSSHPDDIPIHRVKVPFSDVDRTFDSARWGPRLLAAIRRLDRLHTFDVIWQTAGPFMPLAVLPAAKRLTGLPYIVDLRDSWTLAPYTAPNPTAFGRLERTVAEQAEPAVLRGAARITTATDGIAAAYRDRYPALADRFVTVTNGYDESVHADPGECRSDGDGQFKIVYAGKFGWYRDPRPFMAALAAHRGRDVRFLHVGEPEERVRGAARRAGVSDLVTEVGRQPPGTVAELVCRSDAGLAVSGGSRQEMTTKVFDYIAAHRPILALGPRDGSMACVVAAFENGVVASNRDVDAITALGQLLDERPRELGSGPYEEYTRTLTAERMSSVFDDVVAERYDTSRRRATPL
ncbi:MAG: glycosyltransferase [Candidatus Wenzhouxiangella sp. M2_3B_020]